MGWLEVGDELDRWVPPIGERVRGEGEVGRRGSVGPSAGGVLGLGEKNKREGERETWADRGGWAERSAVAAVLKKKRIRGRRPGWARLREIERKRERF
jgi:hypothetical protein